MSEASTLSTAAAQHRLGLARAAVKSAQAQTVVDAWLAIAEASGDGHHTDLAGVAVLSPADGWSADFARLGFADAQRLRCVVIHKSPGSWALASEDPWGDEAVRAAQRLAQQRLPVLACTRAVFDALSAGSVAVPAKAPVTQQPDPAGVIAFVDGALRAAAEIGASDVHFECDRSGVAARHRLDGILVPHAHLAGVDRAEESISRIKVLAKLDITERRTPQDGRFRLMLEGHALDVRVSIIPSVHGEDAVLRLLDKAQLRGESSSIDLNFGPQDASRIRELSLLPSGLLLVTGPTGSGKTTTVYAALSEINSGIEKIVTIEDPVEYELRGVLQVPVNERKGLTFAKGLRAILRHDPDRILVGEIRDAETASIAVQSALTGHLVFTTVHANNFNDVVGRFRHFDIDMFGFMSALNGVVVQRLLRRTCSHCAVWQSPSAADNAWFDRHAVARHPQVIVAQGCTHCRGTGYSGRLVAAEVHSIDDTMRDLVTEGAPLSVLKQQTLRSGVRALVEQAADHMQAGNTTLAEVRRVIA
jgi:general secretion pathway protein E